MAALQNTLAVPYHELVDATGNFADSNILGKGGYGIVYKGYWKQLNVAIKRITAQGVKGKQVRFILFCFNFGILVGEGTTPAVITGVTYPG